jgi:hypothetical protein
MSVLLLDRITMWMWVVMPVFHRYMLPPSSGIDVSMARECSCGYRFWANRPHHSLCWFTGPNMNTVSPRALGSDGEWVYLWNIGSTAHSHTVLRHTSGININTESLWKPEIGNCSPVLAIICDMRCYSSPYAVTTKNVYAVFYAMVMRTVEWMSTRASN